MDVFSSRVKIASLFFLSLITPEVRSQVYPVQGSATLIPPYALRLSDYSTSVSERFVLNALLADVTHADLHVRFRISIVSQSVKLETKPEYIGTPVSLQSGVPLRLTNVELAEYFDVNHLNFSGISKSEFLKTGFLPEGFYQFCFEVYEYNRGVKISNTICAPAWLILNDPPLINLPFSGTKLKPLSPQNVIMQWTPRHTGSPNAAFTTEYDLKVVEVWPSNRNPNDAILTQPSIFETTTNSTAFVYGPEATPLEPGRVYAFRVQARAMAGAEHFDLFKNNGYSEAVIFTYGDACDPPVNVEASAASPSRVSLQWDASPSQTGYTLRFRPSLSPTRESGSRDEVWYFSSSLIPALDITDLQPNTTYEYQLMSTCGPFESDFSSIASITTPDMAQRGYTCGMPLENFDLDPLHLIPTLKVGEVIKAGDFDVTLTMVTGGNGQFSGEGSVVIPLFNNVKGRVRFENITVNSDKRMVDGFMEVMSGGVNVMPTELTSMMDQLTQSLSVADSILALARQYVVTAPDPNVFVPDEVITIQAGIKTVIKDPATGNVIVTDNNGISQTLPAGKNVAITDGQGNGVIVNTNGGKTDVSGSQLASILQREYNLSVTFSKAATTSYGLDEQKIDALKNNYEKLADSYYVSWKAVSSALDPIVATYSGKDNIADKIKFELDGVPALVTANGNAFTINVGVSATQTPSSIVAKATVGNKEQILGKLNVVGYDLKVMNLKVVKVNNAELSVDAAAIKTQLDKIYSQAVVSWNVKLDNETLQVADLSDPFDDGDSGLLSNYTNDMKTVIHAYDDLDPDTYYLFLIDKPASGNKLGFMPRAKQVGFIFTDPHNNDATKIINTMAHELGHGAFTLKHTFSDYPSLVEGNTDNLMDYGNGTTLWKYQWDRIHDPAVVLGLFQDDAAGALVNSIQGKPVAMLGDSTMKEKKAFLYQGTGKQMKVKFETSATTQTKMAFKLTMEIETSNTKLYYPSSGYDTLIFNQTKTISLDSIPEAKYTLVCKLGTAEFKRDFYIRKHKFEITTSQLKAIFPSTEDKRIQEVVSAINNNSLLFALNTRERMAHFIGQIGAETGGLKKLKEDFNYTAQNIFNTFLKPNLRSNTSSITGKTFWFCDLVEGYDCTSLNACIGTNKSMADCSTAIPVKLKNETCAWAFANFDSTYNVKTSYISNTSLFDYVYGCRMDNGDKSTKDGSTYLGKGFIHLTGKYNYKLLSEEWNRLYDDKKKFHEADIDLLETNPTIAIKASMIYWKIKNLNQLADLGVTEKNINDVGVKINGGDPPNGAVVRKQFTQSAINNFNE